MASSLPPMQSDPFLITRDELERSPSVLAKIFSSWQEELERREILCVFITEAGAQLRIPQIPVACASVYLNRFYTRHAFTEYPQNVVCAACLFLAAKVEEHRRKIQDVISVVRRLNGEVPLQPETPEYNELRDYIFQCERELLDTIEYRLQIDLPYHYLIEAVNRKTSRMLRGRTDADMKAIAQNAWLFLNDCMKTPSRLIFTPQTIAVTCLELGVFFFEEEKNGSAPSTDPSWIKEEFNVEVAHFLELRPLILTSLERLSRRAAARTGPHSQAVMNSVAAAVAASSAANSPSSTPPPSASALMSSSSASASATTVAAASASKRPLQPSSLFASSSSSSSAKAPRTSDASSPSSTSSSSPSSSSVSAAADDDDPFSAAVSDGPHSAENGASDTPKAGLSSSGLLSDVAESSSSASTASTGQGDAMQREDSWETHSPAFHGRSGGSLGIGGTGNGTGGADDHGCYYAAGSPDATATPYPPMGTCSVRAQHSANDSFSLDDAEDEEHKQLTRASQSDGQA